MNPLLPIKRTWMLNSPPMEVEKKLEAESDQILGAGTFAHYIISGVCRQLLLLLVLLHPPPEHSASASHPPARNNILRKNVGWQ